MKPTIAPYPPLLKKAADHENSDWPFARIGYWSRSRLRSGTSRRGQRQKARPQELQAATSPLQVQQVNLRPEAGGKRAEPRNSAPVLAPELVGSASTAPAGRISEPGTEFVDSIDHEPATEPSIAPPARASPLPLGFGEFASVEGISVANWKELAATHRDLAVGWSAIVKNYLLGGPTDGSAWAQMMGGYNKLQDFGARVRGKLPSHVSNKNGELTHPLVMANLLVGELRKQAVR